MKLLPSNPDQIIDFILGYGKKLGADEMEIGILAGHEFSVDVRKGEIENLVDSGDKTLSFKVILDHRTSSAATSDFSKDILKKLVGNAVERAGRSHQDPFSELPELEHVPEDISFLKLYDHRIPEIPPVIKIETAKTIEAICLSDKRIHNSLGAGYSTFESQFFLANSKGFRGNYRQTIASCGVFLQAGENDHIVEEGWHDSARNLDDLMPAELLAKKAIMRTTRLIGARRVQTQNVPVVYEFPVASSLLAFLYGCLEGNMVYLKQTFLSDQLHEQIASSVIDIYDDGLIPGAPGSKPFDGEGVPTRKTPVIEKGVLKTFLTDTYSSKKLCISSTGNASGPNNFYLDNGSNDPEEIIRSVDKGLFLTGTIGQGMVAATGDISRGAFGIWIEKGELSYPVAEITISGNLGRMLKNIEMVGNDLNFRSSVSSPTIKISEMTVGGLD